MDLLRRPAKIVQSVLIGALALMAAALGVFTPVDDALRALRFASASTPASGDVVFVEIDASSLRSVGVWPWPRSVYADLLDRLVDMGAAEIALDIDFSTASTEAEDAAFEAGLERAGGYAILVAFKQTAGDGTEFYNQPLPRFAAQSGIAAVNVVADADGRVRTYPYGVTLDGRFVPSLGATLAKAEGPADTSVSVDYSIDLKSIPRVPVLDILTGSVAPGLFKNRQVVIGASALELRDLFLVPRYGFVPGAVVQILAAETLIQRRALQPLGLVPLLALVALVAIITLIARRYVGIAGLVVSLVAMAAGVEALALALQFSSGWLLNTFAVHATLVGLAIVAAAEEILHRRRLHREAADERDAMQRVLDRVITDNFDGVLVIDQQGRILAASRLAESLLGDNLVGRTGDSCLPAALQIEIAASLEGQGPASALAARDLAVEDRDGKQRLIEYAITLSDVITGGQVAMRRVTCVTFRDVSQRRADEHRLRYLARHDPLTGALSRLALSAQLDALFSSQEGRLRGATVLLVDLSRFKSVNDALGHSYGDRVLKQVLSRLNACGADCVARVGGDSFALALARQLSPDELSAFCDTIIGRVSAPFEFEQHRAMVGARIGVTTSDTSGFEPEVLLSHADMALSAAKAGSGNLSVVFSPDMDAQLRTRQEMELELQLAIDRGDLFLHYQPLVQLDDEGLVGVEALVRWQHARLGSVSPGMFIPVAEETGLIVELGRYVLEAACREVASWPGRVRVAINVSPIQFELSDVVADVERALTLSGLAPDRLDIEITEGIFLTDTGAVMATLGRLRGMGIGIALDDFGTGYSSLSYLGRLPIDKIKIDRSFVAKLPADPEASAIIRAVLTLSETLGKVVVAEGIETADQAWMLRLMGCTIGQGFHFGRPRPAAEIVARLDSGIRAADQALAG